MDAMNIAALEQVKLFAGLAAEDLVALAANLQRRRYGKGQFIFQQGDPGLCLYLVESGKVKIASFSSEGKGLVLNLWPGGFLRRAGLTGWRTALGRRGGPGALPAPAFATR